MIITVGFTICEIRQSYSSCHWPGSSSLSQLDVMHVLADNISKEIKHGNILAQTLLGIPARFFGKNCQYHLQQHGRFMFIAVNLVKSNLS